MIEQFFTSNMGYVYLVYGFAFIFMGVSILVQPKTYGLFVIAKTIWLLSVFALLHGINEWLDMVAFIYPEYGILKVTSFVCLMSSFCFLFEFGRGLVKTDVSLNKLSRLLQWWLMPAVSVVILVITFNSREWLVTGQILSRYFIALPGTILTAVGLNAYRKETDNIESSRLDRYNKYIKIATAFFIAYAFFAGLLVPKGGFFPSNILNTGSFLSVVHIPVQVFKTISALIIAFSILGMIRIASESLLESDIFEDTVNKYNIQLGINIRNNNILSWLTGFLLITSIILMIFVVNLVKDREMRKIHNNALERINIYNRYLKDKIGNNAKFPKLLSERPYVIEHMKHPDKRDNINDYLYQFNESIGAAITYIVNVDGIIIASSNYNTTCNLVGINISHKEYFKGTIKGITIKYMDIGARTKKPGLFISHPIKNDKDIIGVVIIKFNLETFIPYKVDSHELFFIVDNNGVIFHSSDERYNYYTELQLPEDLLQKIKDSKQYADEPLLPLPIIKKSEVNHLTFVTMRHQNQSGNGFTDVEYLEESIYDNQYEWNVRLFADVYNIGRYIDKYIILSFMSISSVLSLFMLVIYRSKAKTKLMNNYMNYFLYTYRKLSEQNQTVQTNAKKQTIISAALNISLSNDSFEAKLQMILKTIFLFGHPMSSIQTKGCIFISDEKSHVLQMAASHGFSEELVAVCSKVPYGKCLCGLAVSTNDMVFSSNCNDDEHHIRFKGASAHGHYCLPIKSSTGILGVINIYTKAECQRNDDDEQFLTSIAHILAVVIQRNKEMQILEMDRSASVTTLAAGIAHEINNPLSFIKTSVSTLNKYLVKIESFVRHSQISPSHESLSGEQIEAPKRDKILDMLSMMGNKINSSNRGIERIMEVVNALKMFSRLNKEGFTDVDINRCIDETLSILITESRNVNIIKEYSELPPYLCEPQAMNQCFYHIIENAIHAVDVAGTGNITISTSHIPVGEAQDETIQVRIADDGAGMSEETVKRAFVPFYTTKEVGSGKGLGLSIVDGVIKRHGGTVDIESTEGKGTSVTIQLRLGQNV
ncbi:MAG: GAF domain-containing protein [Nitrospirae bacterium]|nr:GAF domain-containing protein [Nitrospirota bacterium]